MGRVARENVYAVCAPAAPSDPTLMPVAGLLYVMRINI
jgi:hypothetical protein